MGKSNPLSLPTVSERERERRRTEASALRNNHDTTPIRGVGTKRQSKGNLGGYDWIGFHSSGLQTLLPQLTRHNFRVRPIHWGYVPSDKTLRCDYESTSCLMKRMQIASLVYTHGVNVKNEKITVCSEISLRSLTVLPSSFVILVILWTRQILLNMAP